MHNINKYIPYKISVALTKDTAVPKAPDWLNPFTKDALCSIIDRMLVMMITTERTKKNTFNIVFGNKLEQDLYQGGLVGQFVPSGTAQHTL